MINFLSRYSEFFFLFLPIWFIAGNLFSPLSLGVLFFFLVLWKNRGLDHFLIITLFLVLILGDSRAQSFQFIKDCRILVVGFLFLVSCFEINKGKYPLHNLFFSFLPFFFIAILSFAASPVLPTSVQKTTSYFFLIFTVLHYLRYYFLKYHYYIFIDLVYLIGLIFIAGVLYYFVDPSFVIYRGSGRFQGLMGNPNGLGVLVFLSFILTVILRKLYPFRKRLFDFLLFLMFVLVIWSNSRGSLLGVLIFSSVYFLYRGKKQTIKNVFLMILVPGLALVLPQINLLSLITGLGLGDYIRVENFSNASGRFLAWEIAFNKIPENLLLGRGFGYNEYYYNHILKEFFAKSDHQGMIHNSFITILFNNGVLGFITFVFFMGKLLMSFIQKHQFFFPILLAVIASASFEDWLTASLNAFFIVFLGIIIIMMDFDYYQRLGEMVYQSRVSRRSTSLIMNN